MPEKDVIITYDTIYETLRTEKYREELQKLPKTFFSDVIKYLSEKTLILKSQEEKQSIFSLQETQKTRLQIENTQKILKELYDRREAKIVQLSMFASRTGSKVHDPEVLLEEEKMMFTELTNILNNFRANILFNLLEAKNPEIKEKPKVIKTLQKDQNKLVLIKSPVPSFIADDLKVYGPFEAEEIANLPSKSSEILIVKQLAEEL